MSSSSLPIAVDAQSQREAQLQRLVSIYVVTGLLFMLLPGTMLGVWNLISISSQQSLSSLSASWLQAHGHAQIFGWIGTFVIGIGYYSLSKMGRVLPFAVSRGWLSWGLWTFGLILRWIANLNRWHWRVLLPASAGFELAAFLIFFLTVSRHKRGSERAAMETWMKLVIASEKRSASFYIRYAGFAQDGEVKALFTSTTLCGSSSLLIQVTFEPTRMLRVRGLNSKSFMEIS